MGKILIIKIYNLLILFFEFKKMNTNSFDNTFMENILSESDETKKEEIINQLKQHLYELENSNIIVEELSNKFTSLQKEFKSLSLSKKQIESDLNSKINNLESEKEILNNKYISTKNQIKSLISNYSKEINELNNINQIIKQENEYLKKENKNLIQQISSLKNNEDEVIYYKEKLEEANKSILRLNNFSKELEDKNEKLINKFLQNDIGNNQEIIIKLKKIIEEKENLISNLYNSFDKISDKYEEILKKHELIKKENLDLKNYIYKKKLNNNLNTIKYNNEKNEFNTIQIQESNFSYEDNP